MFRSQVPLNALRAFEASARHLSFTKAALELFVTQAAVSHQIRSLEEILGVRLFRRLSRGLALTDEGQALVPVLEEAFDRIQATLDRFENGHFREVVTVGAVGTFATGWLMPRLPGFQAAHPYVDLRLQTNNNRVDLAGEGLDYAIRFGDGSWHGTEAATLFPAPLTPVAAPAVAARLAAPADLAGETLLRSYRADEWSRWFAAAGIPAPATRGAVLDSSIALAEAAAQGMGVALVPTAMFGPALAEGRLVRPFPIEIAVGSYWLTALKSKRRTAAMQAFRTWLLARAAESPA
jgi:LysR family transcriptional regulator of beta-lactamase